MLFNILGSPMLKRSSDPQRKQLVSIRGDDYITKDGEEILDASCGAGVSCLGPGTAFTVLQAISQQMLDFSYVPHGSFRSVIVERYCHELRASYQGFRAPLEHTR